VSKAMKANRGSGTKPELVLSKLLRKRLVFSELPGRPDFVYPRARLAVFVHGCWWHRCPIDNLPLPKRHRSYWKRKFERNVERDRLNREELESIGWRVVEIWEHEIKENPEKAANRIRAIISVHESWAHRKKRKRL
jgi:DNA mismatch endonuclease (patch repair protein)